tara:strand:+ start:52902 stop:53045 length:144 start_codon:yes stop_codon:yes gene_type:complete
MSFNEVLFLLIDSLKKYKNSGMKIKAKKGNSSKGDLDSNNLRFDVEL